MPTRLLYVELEGSKKKNNLDPLRFMFFEELKWVRE